jgi:hypothetical protein
MNSTNFGGNDSVSFGSSPYAEGGGVYDVWKEYGTEGTTKAVVGVRMGLESAISVLLVVAFIVLLTASVEDSNNVNNWVIFLVIGFCMSSTVLKQLDNPAWTTWAGWSDMSGWGVGVVSAVPAVASVVLASLKQSGTI